MISVTFTNTSKDLELICGVMYSVNKNYNSQILGLQPLKRREIDKNKIIIIKKKSEQEF